MREKNMISCFYLALITLALAAIIINSKSKVPYTEHNYFKAYLIINLDCLSLPHVFWQSELRNNSLIIEGESFFGKFITCHPVQNKPR